MKCYVAQLFLNFIACILYALLVCVVYASFLCLHFYWLLHVKLQLFFQIIFLFTHSFWIHSQISHSKTKVHSFSSVSNIRFYLILFYSFLVCFILKNNIPVYKIVNILIYCKLTDRLMKMTNERLIMWIV